MNDEYILIWKDLRIFLAEVGTCTIHLDQTLFVLIGNFSFLHP